MNESKSRQLYPQMQPLTKGRAGRAQDVEVVTKLSLVERATLERQEEIVTLGIRASKDARAALANIRIKKLYREFGTFEDYCRKKWNFSGGYGRKLLKWETVDHELTESGCEVLPTKESQARELSKAAPGRRAAIMLTAAAESPNGDVTARKIAEVRDRRDGEASPGIRLESVRSEPWDKRPGGREEPQSTQQGAKPTGRDTAAEDHRMAQQRAAVQMIHRGVRAYRDSQSTADSTEGDALNRVQVGADVLDDHLDWKIDRFRNSSRLGDRNEALDGGFVILRKDFTGGKDRFMSHGGYGGWTTDVKKACHFPSQAKAKIALHGRVGEVVPA